MALQRGLEREVHSTAETYEQGVGVVRGCGVEDGFDREGAESECSVRGNVAGDFGVRAEEMREGFVDGEGVKRAMIWRGGRCAEIDGGGVGGEH